MRQLLSGLSIKIQILIPVLFSVVLLLAGVIIGGDKLESAFKDVSVSTDELILHKEELSEIVDNSYGMRIKAIYSLFNADDVKTLVENKALKEKLTTEQLPTHEFFTVNARDGVEVRTGLVFHAEQRSEHLDVLIHEKPLHTLR